MTVTFQTSLPRQRVAVSLASSHLDWLYNQCESEMGIKSSHEASVAQIQGGGASPQDHERVATHPRVLGAAKRNREIRANLEAIGPERAAVLERYHRHARNYPRQLQFHFEEYCGVVWWLECAGKAAKEKWTAASVASAKERAKRAISEAYEAYDRADFERRLGKCRKLSQGT